MELAAPSINGPKQSDATAEVNEVDLLFGNLGRAVDESGAAGQEVGSSGRLMATAETLVVVVDCKCMKYWVATNKAICHSLGSLLYLQV